MFCTTNDNSNCKLGRRKNVNEWRHINLYSAIQKFLGLVTKQFQGHGKMMYFISMLYETQLVLLKRGFVIDNNVYNIGIKLKLNVNKRKGFY